MPRRPLTLALLLALAAPAFAAKDKEADAKWDVETSLPAPKTITFDTDEGTWMNLDVSPDGKHVVFDLLGDLYLLPIEGGTAKHLTTGRAFDVQPRFSPDGRRIAFTSDRAGGNNLWRIDVDGKNATQISKENFRLLNNPVWTPDGQYVIGRKHFTSERSLGAGELWLYHTGGGNGLQLTKRKNDQQDLGEPAVSPDGRYVYFSEDVSQGPSFQYNKNPHDTIYAIRRLDRQTGEILDLVDTAGGAVRPQPSPDGKSLAFVKRVRDKTVLHLLDLASGAVRPLWDGLTHDQQEGWAIFGPYPNYAWLPDSASLVIWAQGKLWRVDAKTGTPSAIPFTANVEQKVAEPLRFTQKLDAGEFTPKMIRDVATSPDGRTVVFHAVGHLWKKTLPDGAPARLASDESVFEYQPSFSADGRKLLYTTWSDATFGAVHELDLASGQRRTLTTGPGFYYGPRYSNDGTRIVWSRAGGGGLTGQVWSGEPGIYVLDAAGGDARRIADAGSDPQFNADGTRVLFFTGGGLDKKLRSIGVHGDEPRDELNLKYVDFVSVSPDGKWIAFTELFNAYVAPLPATGGAIDLSRDTTAMPVTKITADVGSYLHWSGDSQSVHWMVGDQYYTRALKDAFAFVPGAPKDLPKPASLKGTPLAPRIAVDTPSGTVAFVGAKIITMRDAQKSQEVIEDGVVLVEGDTIRAIGAKADVRVPDGAKVIDAAGKTIIPGIVDVHAHAAHFGQGVVPQQNWAYYANLAFGITTMHDPSATSEFVFSQSELVKSGAMVGPRVFSTGTILYGADGDFKAEVNSLDDARSHLRRMKSHGAFSVKSYNQPRREQHQQINAAAREQNMLVVEEGGSTLFHNIPMILDGVTSIEHNLPIAPLYRDVVELMRGTDVRNTPTLVVTFGGLSGERWWYSRDQVWEEPRLNRFFPRETLNALAIRREVAPDWDYYHVDVAKAAKTLRDAGVRIQVGGHGQLQGQAPHWEVWMLTQGGFTPWEALRAATIDGADLLGLSGQIGSIEAGKRADLVVLDNDPLADIRASDDTSMVMVNGRLFDVKADMAEIGGRNRSAPQFFWQRQGSGATYGIEYGPTAPCHCPKGRH